MPTEAENIQYLYLVLTQGGAPNINWPAVATALSLNKGAATKRWSRLKNAMDKGDAPSASSYAFLWLCVKYSSRDKPLNWVDIAEECNTTPGAASKRYSRMKQVFEQGDAVPGSPASRAGTPRKSRAKSGTATADDDDADVSTPKTTPKRKRAPAKKKPAVAAEDDESDDAAEVEVKSDPDDGDDSDGTLDGVTPSKRRKTAIVKNEVVDDDDEGLAFGGAEDEAVNDDVHDWLAGGV
ncbi:hypothetical protein P153DRAFT_431425 [Dothidotthia symphoricarpi CBS 119687]|uniref:Myb-like DNA-binding domain-containing protein n=1 Tax=Dothidotthia symphoricarpi CBS 119687 TaxID=1392245 RepID=A0A6A6AEU9_9PLEO|nr:uncharacterized protein P153DRAFT_431425 [Dothidotthia symphoricarpi CBS 119687]KAF2129474.1 hypothetical protein P153DRAFT_431425 [Dothidotthia symphoricarpi CBS 119687]